MLWINIYIDIIKVLLEKNVSREVVEYIMFSNFCIVYYECFICIIVNLIIEKYLFLLVSEIGIRNII